MKLPSININSNRIMQGDATVWVILIILCMISLVEVYSASSVKSYGSGEFYRPVIEQGTYLLGGILVAWTLSKFPCMTFKILCAVGLLISIGALIFVLGAGRINGAARWIRIAGITIQPSEFAKLTLVGFVSFALATWRDKETGGASKYAFKWVAAATGLVCLLIVTENFSTAGIIFLVILLMCWYAQAPKKWLITLCSTLVLFAGLGLAVVKLVPRSAVEELSTKPGMHRTLTWYNRINSNHELPADPADYEITDRNIQVTHAQIAVASCNIIGKGPGQSVERDFLPQAFSDFIYAIIIEEGGIIAGFVVLSLYLLLLYRAMRIASRCKNRFPAYLVMGLALMLVTQALVNMAVAVGAMPVTGQPLPLVSKGGTSTFITCAYIGMILSVSHTAKQKPKTVVENG